MWWSWWQRFGRLPAVPVVAGSLMVQAVSGLTLPLPMSIVPGLLAALAFGAYCLARPAKGWDIFWAGALPQYGSMLLHDITGLAEWWLYAALIPLAALWAAAEEREAHEEAHRSGPREQRQIGVARSSPSDGEVA